MFADREAKRISEREQLASTILRYNSELFRFLYILQIYKLIVGAPQKHMK